MNEPFNSEPDEKTPRWETVAMIGSFVLVWAYFLAFGNAQAAKMTLHFGWKIALLAAVGVLIWVFIRRLRRILAALNGQNKRR